MTVNWSFEQEVGSGQATARISEVRAAWEIIGPFSDRISLWAQDFSTVVTSETDNLNNPVGY